MESDIWTEYGGEVQEEKNDKNKVYTKWKPPKNKLTQEISRKKSIAKPKAGKAGKAVAIDTTRRASKMMDSAMMSVSAGPGKSSSQIYFYDWSDNYRRVLKEIKMQRQMTLSSLGSRAGSEVSRSPSRASKSSEDSGHASHRSSQFRGVTRKLGAARPVLTKADGSSLTPTSKDISRTTSLGSIDGRKNSRKGSSSTVKDLVDTRWPKTMWDNMSGFWRMQCSGDSFRITPAHYSLYLDPVERERTLSISWKTYMDAKEKCLKWLSDYQDHFSV